MVSHIKKSYGYGKKTPLSAQVESYYKDLTAKCILTKANDITKENKKWKKM